MLFEKSGNFSQNEHRDRFDSSAPPVSFHLLFKDPPAPSTTNPGSLTGVENMDGGGGGGRCSSKFDWESLSQYMGEEWGGVKILL